MSQLEDSARKATQAPEELPPVVVWHRRAEEYRRALAPRLPGVRIETVSGLRASQGAFDARVLLTWTIPPGELQRFPQLQWVQSSGAGVDHLLVRDDLGPGVLVTRSLGRFGAQTAEYVIGYLLSLLLGVETYRRDQDRAVWRPRARPLLRDLTVGIVGLGSLGSEIAEKLDRMGAQVLGVCRQPRPVPHVQRVFPADGWRDMLPHCGALVLAAPLTAETRGMVDAEALAALPPEAALINISRGALIDEKALLGALRAARLQAAVLDTFETEPLAPESQLWTEPRAWITPHVAGPSEVEPIAEEFADNYRRFAAGAEMANMVDRELGY